VDDEAMPAIAGPRRTTGPRIVLADDNADMRGYLERLLSTRYRVVAVANGEEALAAIARQRPELVLTDVMMPKLDGFGLVRALRRNDQYADLPVIMLSARAGEEAKIEGLEKGADDYLVKPFSARELLARVDAQIELARVRREAAESLRESDDREAYLLQLSDALRPLADPIEIQAEASRVLGERVGASRTLYCEVELEAGSACYVVQQDHLAPGERSLVGRWRASDFGAAVQGEMLAGRTVTIADVAREPRFGAEERAAYRAIGICAYVAVPLIKKGRHVACLAVHQSAPRVWTAQEIQLVQETAERTWATLERARAEAALRDSEERLRLALDASRMGTFVWYVDEDRTEPDARMLELFGLEPGGTLTLSSALARLIHPDDRERYAAAVARALDPDGTGELREELRVVHPNGAERWVSVLGRTAFGGTPRRAVRVAGIAADITERQRAEQAIRNRTAQVETLIDRAPLGVYMVDADLRIREVNPVARPVFGDIPGGVVGRDFEEVMHILWEKEYADEMVRIFHRTLETGEPYVTPERAEFRADRGVVEYYEWRLDRITQPDGSFGLVCYFRDISEQVHAREELKDHRDNLKSMVEQRTAELEASHQRLRMTERLASLGTLSAGLGHDMGNLLVPVRVRLESLGTMDLPESARKELFGIKSAADYLQKLASGLRLLAVDPTRSVDGEPTELRGWWSEAAPVLKNTLPRGVTLVADFPETSCWVTMPRAALMQSVFNLVQNAGDAMREGASGSVTVSVECGESLVQVKVADTGPGMTEEVKRRCMEPFFTTKARGISTGLGLALVYGLVRDSGGTVECESVLGQGTTFVLSLRRANPAEAKLAERSGKAAVVLRDARLRAIVTAELQSFSYEVRFGPEGAAEADLVIADEAGVAPVNGKLILLADQNGAAGSAVALGPRPKVEVIREALRGIARGSEMSR
jgi:PAS domain S-box-containing protein